MKTTFLFFTFISFLLNTQAQVFKGIVFDKFTDSTLCYATVYISGTSAGTYTNCKGQFTLDISKYRSMPVTISLIGYQTVIIQNPELSRLNKIYLSPVIKELNEVVVVAQENRISYLKLFKQEFLGETINAKYCKILNEDDLRFSFSDLYGERILNAYAKNPIIIKNMLLGYTITYYLDKFRCSYHINSYGNTEMETLTLGNYLFKDNLSTFTPNQQKRILERRQETFLGSRMHFFRVLYQQKEHKKGPNVFYISDSIYHSPGFRIRTNSGFITDSLVVKNDSISAYLNCPEKLSVRFQNHQTRLTVKLESVYFQKNGFFNPFDVSFEGFMSTKRIGDLLPFEYQPFY